ncbi:serine hydrolase domain-containing protein [Flavobacterium hiemivividum]|uniref:Class C beta-lactamase-related serine hydrolase n=1 Tax=Flavobacterium hiemivividum TaxID=2541734 RepID=A0A4R5D705_9FLAO|nr:serine hydrolase [Flavobacterium hiemivividum]TDE06235.1 class C beta-lactamase-related serine hydrolase [Flavobacterium hiemivividum]
MAITHDKSKKSFTLLILLALTLQTMAQEKQKFLSAKESEPSNFGWMEGFPPPAAKVLHSGDGSFFKFPAIRYSVVHMREFLPTIRVSKGLKAPSVMTYELDGKIDELTFTPWNTTKKMTWEESLAQNYTDGMIILHKGKVIYERYFGALTETEVHAVMSLTKSLNGTLASILVAEGTLDETKLVPFYVPELKNSAYADATVRDVMDMTTALNYSEDYANPNADVWQFSNAGNPLPKPKDYKGPEGYYEYLETVKKQGVHGEIFGYKTVNADALGWIIARASGKSVNELLSERIWSKIGMEQDAYYQVDSKGIAFTGGGFNAGLRDLARFGELLRKQGNWNGEQLFPAKAVQDIARGGSVAAFEKSEHPGLKGWSYRNMWWITENKDGAYAARGVHGQTIYIDPFAEMVLVRLSSHPVAGNAANDATSLPAYQAVADYLINKK